jgi:hypothetical protein
MKPFTVVAKEDIPIIQLLKKLPQLYENSIQFNGYSNKKTGSLLIGIKKFPKNLGSVR